MAWLETEWRLCPLWNDIFRFSFSIAWPLSPWRKFTRSRSSILTTWACLNVNRVTSHYNGSHEGWAVQLISCEVMNLISFACFFPEFLITANFVQSFRLKSFESFKSSWNYSKLKQLSQSVLNKTKHELKQLTGHDLFCCENRENLFYVNCAPPDISRRE